MSRKSSSVDASTISTRSLPQNSPTRLSSLSPFSLSRSVTFSTSVFPSLRRPENKESMPTAQKPPMLTLKLSSRSFLDSIVMDERTSEPVYTITTVNTTTALSRKSTSVRDGLVKASEIKWPGLVPIKGKVKESDGVQIHMRGGRWKRAEEILQPGTLLSAPQKFYIPGYGHSLRWKRVAKAYWCTTGHVKGPIAVLEPGTENATTLLKVFETLHDKQNSRSMSKHAGVSILLLDYLTVTSLLLVTDVQEWMMVRKFDGREPTSSSASNQAGDGPNSISASQLLKVFYGEPLFPKQSTATLTDNRSPSTTQKLDKGEPNVSSVRTPSPDFSSSDSESLSYPDHQPQEHRAAAPIPSRPPSPSAESIFYPLTNSSAPSHTYLDPTFYNEENVPPVPPLPAFYSTPGSSRSHLSTFQSLSTSELAESSLTRSRTAPAPIISHHAAQEYRVPELPRSLTINAPFTPGAQFASVSRRPLPQPPARPARNEHPNSSGLRHVQSYAHIRNPSDLSSRNQPQQEQVQRSLPPTPLRNQTTGPHGSLQLARNHKFSEENLDQWADSLASVDAGPQSPSARFSLDMPPPAYSSINFADESEIGYLTPSISPTSGARVR